MTAYLGIDIGTSAVKAVLVGGDQAVLGEASAELATARPKDLWSEQDPQDWWRAVETVVGHLRRPDPKRFAAVRGIGLTGQMHGAVLIASDGRLLRPAILWNDSRSFREAEHLRATHSHLAHVTGVLPMPGFTAPKLLWLAKHEPEIFRSIRTVLPPKDFVRLQLTGEAVTDLSDAAGTWWLDQASRDWSEEALAACRLDRSQMPRLVEGSQASAGFAPRSRRAGGSTAR